MIRWYQAIDRLESEATPYVIATVLATSGSAPRAATSKMIVSASQSFDSIGGGRLEHLVQQRARTLIDAAAGHPEIQHFPLAAAAEQCCGGSVTVLFEPRATERRRLWLFGAGHVGQCVAQLVSELPFALRWIDSRSTLALNPGAQAQPLPEIIADPTTLTAAVTAADIALIMTHDHELDFQLIAALLAQKHCASIGLIGSRTKWDRFQQRLRRAGVDEQALARVQCPVGLSLPDHPDNKTPMAVAVAIVADLLSRQPVPQAQSPLTWQQIKLALITDGAVHE